MFLRSFQEEIENTSGVKLKLKINDNRSTMLSIRWEPDFTKVSMHRMFLQAPQNVMQALSCYIKQEQKTIGKTIKEFIEEGLKKLDYSHLVDQKKLYSRGEVYDLQQIYSDLNKEYFENKLNLHITWFGKPNQKSRSRVTFGLYHDPLKLIKINRLLDSSFFPDYVVKYVVYHEILHSVKTSYFDPKGFLRIHGKEFKEKELEFSNYALAKNWIKEHQAHLFC